MRAAGAQGRFTASASDENLSGLKPVFAVRHALS